MLGQESLLAVQFLAILLFDSPLSEACADCVTLAPGQEIIKHFQLSYKKLPVQMAYTTNRKTQMQAANMSVSKEQALRTINSYFENAMHDAILGQIIIQGLSKEVIKQIQYMPPTYDPLQCNEVSVQPSTTSLNQFEFDSESSGSAYNCVVLGNRVAGICQSKSCTRPLAVADTSQSVQIQIPFEFYAYNGSLKVYNANVASWNSSTWDQVGMSAAQCLLSGIYVDYFIGAGGKFF